MARDSTPHRPPLSTVEEQDAARAVETTPPPEGEPAPRRTVTLKQPHTHGGVDYEVGAKISVRPDQADRLRDLGVI